jgi:FkbM family methyltransferase
MKRLVPTSGIALIRSMRSGLTWREERALLAAQRQPRYRKGDAPLLGGSVRYIDGASLASSYYSIFGKRIYDFESSVPRPLIIDGGANIGLASLFWNRELDQPHVLAFEPDPDALDALRENLERFGATATVRVHDQAISDRSGRVLFQRDMADGGRIESAPDPEQMTTSIASIRLASLLSEPVALLKLDIEGAEVAAIIDAADALSYAERIFVEYHGRETERQRLHEMLAVVGDAGFRYWIQDEWVPRNPFLRVETDYGMDLRLNIFAIRSDSR